MYDEDDDDDAVSQEPEPPHDEDGVVSEPAHEQHSLPYGMPEVLTVEETDLRPYPRPFTKPSKEEIFSRINQIIESRPEAQSPFVRGGRMEVPLTSNFPKWLDANDLRIASNKPINWVMEGMWTEGAKILLAAEQKVGKTFLVCSICLSMASGLPLWGSIPVLRPGPVGIVAGEDDEGEIGRRLDRMCRAYGILMSDLPIKFLPAQSLRLNRPRDQDFIRRSVEKFDLKLVVYDPLARLMDGDENSKEVVSGVLNPASELARDKGIGVCVVHHLGKQSMDNPKPAIQRVRGSSDITSWFTCGMLISGNMRAGRVQVELVQRVSGKLPADFPVDVIETEDPSVYGLGTLKLQAQLDTVDLSNRAAINEKQVTDACGKIMRFIDGEATRLREQQKQDDNAVEDGLCGVTVSELQVHYTFGRPVLNSALKRLIREQGYLRFEKAEDIPDGKVLVRTPKFEQDKEDNRIEYLYPDQPENLVRNERGRGEIPPMPPRPEKAAEGQPVITPPPAEASPQLTLLAPQELAPTEPTVVKMALPGVDYEIEFDEDPELGPEDERDEKVPF